MNRTDLQLLSEARLEDGVVLLDAGRFAGAFYMFGYSIERALKAAIARQIRGHDFPDRKMVGENPPAPGASPPSPRRTPGHPGASPRHPGESRGRYHSRGARGRSITNENFVPFSSSLVTSSSPPSAVISLRQIDSPRPALEKA